VIFRKVTNGFRCEWGAETYAAFRSVVSTAKANHASVLAWSLQSSSSCWPPDSRHPTRRGGVSNYTTTAPAIVFHGDRDSTVNPRNADAIVAQSAQAVALSKHVEQGRVPGGHDYSRTLSTDAAGRTVIEQWVVHGAGHAWSGGSTAGSYCDPRGPDATREMLRFFLERRHPAPAQVA
jgi:poly(3-hydroxybutyrate) depolymerase